MPRHPFRVLGRSVWAAAELAFAALKFLPCCAFRPARAPRARWLQQTSRRLLRIFDTDIRNTGAVPVRGLLVCNHLSYVDVLVLASLTPALFVAKSEVNSWPAFGWFARKAGTLFIDRKRRTQVGEIADAIESALQDGALVILFPEGTSSDGRTVLPFKSSLLEPAARGNHPLFVGLIEYELADGDVHEEVCYWRDVSFGAHLINLLRKRRLRARVCFQEIIDAGQDRKKLAQRLHAEVLNLKSAAASR